MSIVLLCLFTSLANAPPWGPETEWSVILKSPNVMFRLREDLSGIHFANACLTQSWIKTIQPVPACTKLRAVPKGENKDKWTD